MSSQFPPVCVTSHQSLSLNILLCHFPSVRAISQVFLCHFQSVCVTSYAFVSISGYALSNHSASFPISLCNFSSISAYTLFQKKAVSVSTSLRSFPSTWAPFHMYASLLSVPTNSLRTIPMTLQVSKNHNITDNFLKCVRIHRFGDFFRRTRHTS